MSLDANVVQYIALGAAVAAVLALLLAVVATLRLRTMRRVYTVLQGDGGSDSFVEIVARKSAQVDDLRQDVTEVHQRLDAVQASLADAISHIAVVRYDAFSDMGGRMSFSVAMLDDIGDGLVLDVDQRAHRDAHLCQRREGRCQRGVALAGGGAGRRVGHARREAERVT